MAKSPPVVVAFVGMLTCFECTLGQDSQSSLRSYNPNARYEIEWATCLGGPKLDWLREVVVLPDGALLVAGWATSKGMPVTEGAAQPAYAGGAYQGRGSINAGDAYIAKLSDSGQLMAATYFGGSDNEYQIDTTVDRDGNVIVTGETRSNDLPTTPGCFQPAFGGVVDWFAVKLTPDLKKILWCTYLGGPDWDSASWLHPVLDADGNVILAGNAKEGFPGTEKDVRVGIRDPNDPGDMVVAKLRADGSGLIFCSRFVGHGHDQATGAALLKDGSILLTGFASAADFPFPEKTARFGSLGGTDAFVARLKGDGSALESMTLFGGDNSDFPQPPLLAPDGSIFIAGGTWSSNFPTTPGSPQRVLGEAISDGFLVKIAEPGASPQFAATFGGEDREHVSASAIASDGRIWIAGATGTPNLSVTGDALHFYAGGETDGLLVAFAPDGSRVDFATFLGGMDKDGISDFAFGPEGAIYVVGATDSRDFPATRGAIQPKPVGMSDGFVMKLVPTRPVGPDTRISRR